ncbi:MAG: DUF3054 domain-containing protein [Canibacter sp.]
MNLSRTPSRTGPVRKRTTPSILILAGVLDVVFIIIFAFAGRTSHALEMNVLGVLHTAWPFLVGLLLGWLIFRVHRHPTSLLNGLVVWGSTVVLGLALRLIIGEGAAVAFVLVSTVTLGVFFLGWRLIAAAFRMLSRTPRDT